MNRDRKGASTTELAKQANVVQRILGAPRPDERGQMFAGYRLMIGAIIALVVLVIIINAINYIEQNRYRISTDRFYEGVDNAIRGPDGTQLVIENLTFSDGTSFSSEGIEEMFGLGSGCVEFWFPSEYSVFEGSTTTHLKIEQNYATNVYVMCDQECSHGDNRVHCVISFVIPID